MKDEQKEIRIQLVNMLTKEQAHISFEGAIKNINFSIVGETQDRFPYTIWQLCSHIRFTQKDILDFCIKDDYSPANWPDDYWPDNTKPTQEEWETCLINFGKERKEFIDLIKDPGNDLLAPLPHGTGQNLLREAILICDHTGYHSGQIVLIRKILGDW